MKIKNMREKGVRCSRRRERVKGVEKGRIKGKGREIRVGRASRQRQ